MNPPHVWLEWLASAWAFFSKRDDGVTTDLFWTKGAIDHCMFCEEMRIRPHNGHLAIVSVVLVEWIEVPATKEAA